MSIIEISNDQWDDLINENLSEYQREVLHSSIMESGSLNSYIEDCAESFYDEDPCYVKQLLGDDREIDTMFAERSVEDVSLVNSEPVLASGAFATIGAHLAAIVGQPIAAAAPMFASYGESCLAESDRNYIGGNSNLETNIKYSYMDRSIIGQENHIQQQGADTCAIKSQEIILRDFGIEVSERELVEWSIENGLYTGGGTSPLDVGKILAQADIPCTQHSNANMFDMVNELAQGHKVIVGVDSGELWSGGISEWWEDLFGGEAADHALIVAGIDNRDPSNPQVLITDPGTGDACKSYPLEDFMDAWKDSGCFMVSTDIAPAEFAATQIANSQPTTYLPEIIGQSYQDFQLYHDMASAFPPFPEWNYEQYPSYPTASLFNAFHSDIMVNDLVNQDFFQFVDSDNFATNYSDTLDYGMQNMVSSDAASSFNDYLTNMQGADIASMQGHLEVLKQECLDMGDMNSADFFSQQIDFIDCSKSLGIDPIDFYQDFDFM